MAPLPMSSQVFSILSALVAERCGLHFAPPHAPIFAEKVAGCAVEAGFDSLLDYYYFLRYDAASGAEFDRLVERLVVGETYLFRELGPLETTVAEFVAPLVGTKRPRIWCAACATGEEALTVAMLLADRGLLGQVDLVASDINAAALARARTGRLGRRALRTELPDFARPWVRVDDRQVVVDERLTQAVAWSRVNLTDEATMTELGTFDVILCRNVLIYFDDETVRQVVERLGRRLHPDGALFVGISESLLRFGTRMCCQEKSGVFFYRKAP